MKNSISVRSLRLHTFNGGEYAEGKTYSVSGDASQTAEQYVETLRLLGFAAVDSAKSEPAKAEKAEAKAEPDYKTRDLKAKR